MRLYVLVEGPSEKALLDVWLERLLKGHRYTVIKHRGKGKLSQDPTPRVDPRREGLLDQLPARLRAYVSQLCYGLQRLVGEQGAESTPRRPGGKSTARARSKSPRGRKGAPRAE